MKAKLENRLSELKVELESGQKVRAELEGRRSEVEATLLRISGAIQVLEELLDKEGAAAGNGAGVAGPLEQPELSQPSATETGKAGKAARVP